ncbi:MAG: S46 family peptidase [Acidobacteria bacterium]|nr:S46 family peptidase [Acidobacteriota bacterium]
MKRFVLLLLIFSFCLTFVPTNYADEGMWTFDNPPLKAWKEKYNFAPSQEWMDHIRLSTVKVGNIATGSFVSPEGLIMTNQHVGHDSVAKLSTAERDLVKNGFYADTRGEELKCPDLDITVLVSFENVSERVQAAKSEAERKATMAAIEKDSTEKTGLKSEIITLYNGGEYWLYRFKRYTDVRLVFAPEEQIAYYGGDYDNFTYPRYCLDITFFRVYENDQPAKIEHYLKWSANGANEGDLVIVPGYPGSTARLLTLAQLKYQRDTGNPLQQQVWNSQLEAAQKYAAQGEEQKRQASNVIRSRENSLKRLRGQMEGLGNPRVFRKKEDDEAALRKAVNQKADLKKAYASAWDQIEKAYKAYPAMAKRVAFSNLTASRLGTVASNLIRFAEETRKPNEQRYPEFREERLAALKRDLTSTAPIYPALDEAQLTAWFAEAQKTLGANDPFVKAVLGTAKPEEVAKQLISNTKLADVATRKALFEGGADAIAKSDDPLLVLARKVEPIIRELRAWEDAKIKSVETSAGEKIAKARFAVYGKTIAPDANFNLRVMYGTVAGYEEDTTLVPYKTTWHGLFDRATSFDEKSPFDLPARIRNGKAQLDLATPYNFVYTADTIGGCSGSPVINRNGEIVGINFDSNIQKLPNRYLYIDEKEGSRAVGVHSAAIVEALQKLYGAGRMVEEIRGGM